MPFAKFWRSTASTRLVEDEPQVAAVPQDLHFVEGIAVDDEKAGIGARLHLPEADLAGEVIRFTSLSSSGERSRSRS